ncbi:MAG: DUF1385 domain-containing protein [Myxococcales bacterium]|nr:DUF1385 domain-containing protein [Myxococcales bacterium]
MSEEENRPYIGGQAVLEGVMMRSPHSFAIAVRRADGSISMKERPFEIKASSWSKIPFVRGMATLVESLRLGSEALRFSAELFEKDMEAAEQAEAKPKDAKSTAKKAAPLSVFSAFGLVLAQVFGRADGEPGGSSSGEEEEGRQPNTMALMTIVMVVFMVALPQLLAWGTSTLFKMQLDVRSAKFQLLTGAFKLIVVLGYLAMIRRVPEIYRVFQYHGAEHKTISTYEAREELVVANAKKQTTLHPRCGTTFLIMTVLVSIAIWTALGPLMPRFGGSKAVEQITFFLMKLPFLPVLAGITFEIQRFTARYCLTGPLRALLWPGFLVQKITTIEPDDAQLEIALASMRATLWREKVGPETKKPTSDSEVLAFPSYEALLETPELRAA